MAPSTITAPRISRTRGQGSPRSSSRARGPEGLETLTSTRARASATRVSSVPPYWSLSFPDRVADARALVDVKVSRPSGPRAREDERGDPCRLVLEIRGAVIVEGAIHHAAKALRRPPTEVVPLVMTPGDVQVGEPAEPRSVAVEVHAVPIGGERRGPGVAADGINDRPQIHGRSPIGIAAGALRHPDLFELKRVGAVDASRPARRDVQAQAILRDGRVIVVIRRVDDRAEVDRRGPGAVRRLVGFGRVGCETLHSSGTDRALVRAARVRKRREPA